MEPEQLAAERADAPSPYTAAIARISKFLRTHGEFRGSKSAICERIQMGHGKFYAAFAELESRGDIEVGRDERGGYVRWLAPPAP